MRRNLMRVLSLMFVAVMLAGILSGCGDKPLTPSPTDENGKYTPEITVTTAAQLSIVNFPDGQSYEDNVWTRLLKEKLGVNLEYDWYVTDTGSWYERSNVAIKSNQIPDFMNVDVEQFRVLQESDQLADLSEVYETYASDAVKELMGMAGESAMASSTVNGKLLGIPFTGMPKEAAPILMIRKDWMENLGLSEPKTFADVVKIAEAFVKNDPDGNGVDDTIGLGLDNNIFSNSASTAWQGLNAAFGVQPTIWIKNEEGDLEYGSIQPEMRDYLVALSDMYKQGLLYKDIQKLDASGLESQIINEKCGMAFQPFHAPANALQTLRELTPEAEWCYFEIPTVDGSDVLIPIGTGVTSYWVCSKKFADPAAMIKMLNLYVDIQYGEPTTQEELDVRNELMIGVDGKMWMMAPVKAYKEYRNLYSYQVTNDYFINGVEPALGRVQGVQQIQEALNGNDEYWGQLNIYGVGGCLGVIEKYKEKDCFIVDQYYGPKTKTYSTKWGELYSMEQEVFMGIVTGQKTISEFDKFISDWKRKGGDQITKEINDWYDSIQ